MGRGVGRRSGYIDGFEIDEEEVDEVDDVEGVIPMVVSVDGIPAEGILA